MFIIYISGSFSLQIGGGILSELPFLRSSCKEKNPHNCKDEWEAEYYTFDLNLICGK